MPLAQPWDTFFRPDRPAGPLSDPAGRESNYSALKNICGVVVLIGTS